MKSTNSAVKSGSKPATPSSTPSPKTNPNYPSKKLGMPSGPRRGNTPKK
ncbi:hypothetical protein [Flavobacterium terrae]|uniref:Uncharacterized protein n=1 Tax=Flavobacterium terrae TaxID=415425 RepID=A0A1M6F1Z5_9FLAO|nr:hypothetical protein [Flavobacterium terrae]SHI91712.1 hypothetical protein SAMN05444363_2092 [Flavobacterium terrae]